MLGKHLLTDIGPHRAVGKFKAVHRLVGGVAKVVDQGHLVTLIAHHYHQVIALTPVAYHLSLHVLAKNNLVGTAVVADHILAVPQVEQEGVVAVPHRGIQDVVTGAAVKGALAGNSVISITAQKDRLAVIKGESKQTAILFNIFNRLIPRYLVDGFHDLPKHNIKLTASHRQFSHFMWVNTIYFGKRLESFQEINRIGIIFLFEKCNKRFRIKPIGLIFLVPNIAHRTVYLREGH
ncbi:Uncharacterised protein [Serratia fonticola]|nr:Uncharacterised protein [Serratia fonticola]